MENVKLWTPHTQLDIPRDTSQMMVAGPKTFRRASRKVLSNKRKKLPFCNFGGNRQNIEKKMRIIWEADKGYELVNMDQEGADAKVVAYLCRHARYRELFIQGIKPHLYLALVQHPHAWREKFDKAKVDEALKTDIKDLKKLPFWKELSALIKSSDDWEPRKRFYYFGKKVGHCVDGETEMLTARGWIKCSDYDGIEPIMVWNSSDKKMWFESPIAWHKSYRTSPMLHFNEDHMEQLVTPEHKIGYYANGKFHVRAAFVLRDYKGARVPTSGNYVGGGIELSDAHVKLIAAIQADGHIRENGKDVKFHFSKGRKIKRLLEVLVEGKIEYKIHHELDETVTITAFNIKELIGQLDEQKRFQYSMLNWSRKSLATLVNEIQHWDGSVDYKGRITYTSSHKINLEIVKTLLHLFDKRGTIDDYYDRVYKMGFADRQTSRLNHKGPAVGVNFDGYVYCPTVSTGFFLIRRNGKISVTHNSGNYGMHGNKLRMIILEETQAEIVLDRIESERWLTQYHCELFPEIQADFQFRVARQAKEKRQLRNMLGFPFNITEEVRDHDMNDIYSWVPQSTVAAINERAYCEMAEYIECNDKDWHLLQETHDSITAQVPIDQGEEYATVLRGMYESITMTSPIDGAKFNMTVGCQIGKNWGNYHKDKNPDGLRDFELKR